MDSGGDLRITSSRAVARSRWSHRTERRHQCSLALNAENEHCTQALCWSMRTGSRCVRMPSATPSTKRKRAGIPKADFQFRDFRAKVATEADEATGTKSAQAILGHTTEAMTADYIRHKAGRKVRPSK